MGNKGVREAEDGSVAQCLFCDICEGRQETAEVALRNEEMLVFRPLALHARQHWLVVPRMHIKDVTHLRNTEDHLELLQRMREAGLRVLRERNPALADAQSEQELNELVKFGFHVPPFNSINHLHMHVFELPMASWHSAIIHSSNTWWSWTLDFLVEQIQAQPASSAPSPRPPSPPAAEP